MRILAVDQARHGGWAVFDYDKKALIGCGDFNFESSKYPFEKCMYEIASLIETLMSNFGCSAVFIEDVQMQKNVIVLKQLARLQGALILTFVRNKWLFDIVKPSQWQGYCKASGRTQKEIKAKVDSSEVDGKRRSKQLSMEFVKENYGVETTNDNIADAICIGHYIVHNTAIQEIAE